MQSPPEFSGKPYRYAVKKILADIRPSLVLDVAAGEGWLARHLPSDAALDGLDFFQLKKPDGYRKFGQADLNRGIPAADEKYDAVVCCEAVAYLLNPGLFLESARACLNPQGYLVLTTPNPAYLGARISQLIKGFSPSFPVPGQNQKIEAHMPWHPLTWQQLWLLLGLTGFTDISVHEVPEPKPKHYWERLFAPAARLYAKHRANRAPTPEAAAMWRSAGGDQVLFGRRLVVSAKAR
ncbi:MAG TPA: methyltransferase domain-containing protein [Rhodocyclaceae bacterium]